MANRRAWILASVALALAACDAGSVAPDADAGASGGSTATTGGSGGTSGNGAAGTGATGAVPEPGLTYIQEDELGFSAVDGLILPRQASTSITGYTGTGFADGDPGEGTAISWSVNADREGDRSLVWRYAFGGAAENTRDARLLVNGMEVAENFVFPYTTTWDAWQETSPLVVTLAEGPNFIQLVALGASGLANVDYLLIQGEGITPSTPSFSLSATANDPDAGTVTVDPELAFYPEGTEVTVTAEAEPGYFFQSYTGDVTSANAEHTFAIDQNTRIIARFLPEGAEQDPALVGYATVQDDEGTPYLVTGGSLGEEVTATTLEELTSYLESAEPLVVSFSGLFEGADAIHIASDKTLLGIGDTAHLRGIELAVESQRNVIIKNVAVSHVVAEGTGSANDAIVISDSKNVWVDHCELFSDLDNGKDYYDGLLEIKNGAAFITVSHTEFHDHYKVSLISSGDEQVGDTVIRATYHHNYFHDTVSRLPSIRFGKAHVFNNYFSNNTGGSGVNSRMGAVVKVESNHFENTDDPIGWFEGPETGFWEVSDNVFEACAGSQPTTSTGMLEIPYAYTLDPVADVPASVSAAAGVGK
jgi:pectate lyase